MANKYLDNDGVLYLWGKVKSLVSGAVPTKTSDLTNDSGFITSADVPEGASASTATPLMDGTAAVGTSTAFARGDHVHPSDTAKVDKVANRGLISITKESVTDGVKINYVINKDGAETDSSFTAVSTTAYTAAMQAAMQALNGKANSATTLAGYGITNAYTKTEVDNAIGSAVTNMYKYKGSVATVSALPSSGQTTGDVYNVEATGMNYAWNGTAWDALGEIFTITAITNSELDTICT